MTEITVPAGTYRRVDTASKLVGVLLVAAGLEVGGGTPTGLALAGCGIACAVATVFVEKA